MDIFLHFNFNLSNNIFMGYFSYHNKVMSKIKNGELIRFEFVEEYHGISPCLVLYFSDGKVFPIRDYMFDDYIKLLKIEF